MEVTVLDKLFACFSACFSRQPLPAAAAPNQPREEDLLSHRDLIGLLWNGSTDQKARAAHRVTEDAGAADREVAAAQRRELLQLDVLQPLLAMLRHTSGRLRAAAAQALCNLALEADQGTPEALSACPPPPALGPPWHLIYEALPSLVPALVRLISSPPGTSAPDAAAVLPAAQTLANLTRGAAFVPRVLPLLGLLPELVASLATHHGAELRQQVSQMMLNAALHRGLASALDAAEAPKALIALLLHKESPPGAYERCLCTLYNMLRDEEESARRAADIMCLPNAMAALCSQLLQDQPNCRFLSACLLMCMLRCAADNASDAEWGPSTSERNAVDASGRTPRRRKVRRPEAYRRLVAELGGANSQVLTALAHALDSCINSGNRKEFSYGRREQLLQALVAALHALCTMEEAAPTGGGAQGGAGPSSGAATSRSGAGATPRKQQPLNSSTNSALSRVGGQPGAPGGTAGGQQATERLPLIEQLKVSVVSALLQLLPDGVAASVSGAASGPDMGLTWMCLSMLSLLTTTPAARQLLLAAKHPATLSRLATMVTSVRAFAQGLPGRVGELGLSTATGLGGGTPAPGSSTATPRAHVGASQRNNTASSHAAAVMRDVAGAYLGPGAGMPPSQAGQAGYGRGGRGEATPAGTPGGSEGAAGASLAWGRCQALAAKALRNLAVTEPAAVLKYRGAVPSLLLALYGPWRLAALMSGDGSDADSHDGSGGGSSKDRPRQQPACPQGPRAAPALGLQQQPSQQPDALGPPIPSMTPRPSPSLSPRPSGSGLAVEVGVGPLWSQEVQRQAVAALVGMMMTSRTHAEAACTAVVAAGGIPIIAETMRAAIHAACNPDASNVVYRQNQQQLAAWSAALLGRLYICTGKYQQAVVEALLAPAPLRSQVLAVLNQCSPELRSTTAGVGVALSRKQYGPMYTSLHTRGTAVGASSVGAPLGPAPSVTASLATQRSRQGSEGGASSGPGTPGPNTGAAGDGLVRRREAAVARDEAALAAALEDSGAVVRLAPVKEGAKLSGGDGKALVVAVGAEGDLLASTAATRTPAASPQGDLESEGVLRTSMQAFGDLLSAGPSGRGADAGVRRSHQSTRAGPHQEDDTRASIGMLDLTAKLRNASSALSTAVVSGSSRGAAAGAGLGESSPSSGGCSSSTTTPAGQEGSTTPEHVQLTEAERAEATNKAMEQLRLWISSFRWSFLDDAPAEGPVWGPAVDEDGTAVSLPAQEYA